MIKRFHKLIFVSGTLLCWLGLFPFRNVLGVQAETLTITFSIVNDDQSLPSITLDEPAPISAPTYIMRENVRLNGWYLGLDFEETWNFSTPVMNSMMLYARWDYQDDSVMKAQLSMSSVGDEFKSGTITLSFELFEAMQTDVRYQWQMKLNETGVWRDIAGATGTTYRPLRNGYHGYRLVYRTPNYDGSGQLIDRTRHETSSVWLTIYDEFPWLAVIIPMSFLSMFIIIYFLSFKRPMLLYIDGQYYREVRYRGQEDISDITLPTQAGYRFDGWYTTAQYHKKDELVRMPYRSVRRYGRFIKEMNDEK